jgi:hypothetical protein
MFSVVAYRDDVEIGRAVLGAYPKPNWLIGPSGIPNADDFDIELALTRSGPPKPRCWTRLTRCSAFRFPPRNAFRRAA